MKSGQRVLGESHSTGYTFVSFDFWKGNTFQSFCSLSFIIVVVKTSHIYALKSLTWNFQERRNI